MLTLCSLTSCTNENQVFEDYYSLKEIKGDIKCEYRIGKNAQFADEAIDTDIVFDKEMFLKLFNENASYDPLYIKEHLDECDIKINADTQPDIWNTINDSEINIKVIFDEGSRSISLYPYEDKLYLFVLCMGERAKADEQGFYYMELSEEMNKYWKPIVEKIQR